MRITASAPGKLVLLGEYAVLEGAPALVLAVDRRARVSVTTVADEDWEIVSPTLGISARLRVGPDTISWAGAPQAELGWVATLLARLPYAARLPACRIELDSEKFYTGQASAPIKLGLGSSAALTVALLGALQACAGEPPPSLEACIASHRAAQGGRGSGIDIAAALAGGLSRFQLDAGTGTAACTPLELPDGLHWCCAFSGHQASTSAMLARMAAWRERVPDGYTRHMHELVTIASRGVDAVARNDAAAFLSVLQAFAQALAALGEASEVDIASPAHRALAALAVDCGAVYKSCGAGGGDVGITFAVEDVRVRAFAERATRAGFSVMAMGADPQGLHVEMMA